MDGETLYPVGTVAREAGCSPEWVRRLCDRGVLECLRDASGRRLIRERVLREFLERRKTVVRLGVGAGG